MDRMRFASKIVVIGALLIAGLAPFAAADDCSLNGVITATSSSDHPELGSWQYTLVATWDNASPFDLSHMDLLIGAEGQCSCSDISSEIAFADPAGESDCMPSNCSAALMGYFNCNGDPSLGIGEPLFKFEPVGDAACEPGNSGTLTIVFYSDRPPAPISAPNMFLVDKFATQWCQGQVTGEFPGLPCDPVPTAAGAGKSRGYARM